ncbi:uncharacterized protein LOC143302219 [Babylonia areolata]|uniref:uncharacterized protein LOC143302219 n=1 Tax=Babylonia areolata TaxID=304850 RepID=UPI003FD4ACC0
MKPNPTESINSCSKATTNPAASSNVRSMVGVDLVASCSRAGTNPVTNDICSMVGTYPVASCSWVGTYPFTSRNICSRERTNLVTSTGDPLASTSGCPMPDPNMWISANSVVAAPQVGGTGSYAAAVPRSGHNSSSIHHENRALYAVPPSGSHLADSAAVCPGLQMGPDVLLPDQQRKRENVPPALKVENTVSSDTCDLEEDTMKLRDPSPFFNREEPVACGHQSPEPKAEERGLVGKENVGGQSGFGWEHLQLYQTSREVMGNQDTQESSEGAGDSWSQPLLPEPRRPEGPETSSAQYRPVGITSPMVKGMVPNVAALRNSRACAQSITTANLLQDIF